MYGTGFLPTEEVNLYQVRATASTSPGPRRSALAGLHQGEILERRAAAALRGLLDVLPPRGRRSRPRHPRDLPASTSSTRSRCSSSSAPEQSTREHEEHPRDRGGARRGARPRLPGRQHRRRRPRSFRRRRSTTSRRGSRARIATGRSLRARTRPTTRRVGSESRSATRDALRFPHTLNGTAMTARFLIALLETNQDEAGHVPCQPCSLPTGLPSGSEPCGRAHPAQSGGVRAHTPSQPGVAGPGPPGPAAWPTELVERAVAPRRAPLRLLRDGLGRRTSWLHTIASSGSQTEREVGRDRGRERASGAVVVRASRPSAPQDRDRAAVEDDVDGLARRVEWPPFTTTSRRPERDEARAAAPSIASRSSTAAPVQQRGLGQVRGDDGRMGEQAPVGAGDVVAREERVARRSHQHGVDDELAAVVLPHRLDARNSTIPAGGEHPGLGGARRSGHPAPRRSARRPWREPWRRCRGPRRVLSRDRRDGERPEDAVGTERAQIGGDAGAAAGVGAGDRERDRRR